MNVFLCVCMHIFVNMYVCVCIYLHMCMLMSIYICVCLNVCMCACTCLYLCMYVSKVGNCVPAWGGNVVATQKWRERSCQHNICMFVCKYVCVCI